MIEDKFGIEKIEGTFGGERSIVILSIVRMRSLTK